MLLLLNMHQNEENSNFIATNSLSFEFKTN